MNDVKTGASADAPKPDVKILSFDEILGVEDVEYRDVTVKNWPNGSQRVTAQFDVETHAFRGVTSW